MHPRSKSWLGRNKLYFIVAVPLVAFALAPFPIGCAMIYRITDTLRGHSERPHGTQPRNLVGLWIRKKAVMYDSLGEAFYLMPDGRVAGRAGMTRRYWHFDEGHLFIDSVSTCGNCYRGTITKEHTIRFLGPDRLAIAGRDKGSNREMGGEYARVSVNEDLKARMRRLQNSENEEEWFKARVVLQTVEQFEAMTEPKE